MIPPSSEAAEHTAVEHAFVFFLACLVVLLMWEVSTKALLSQRQQNSACEKNHWCHPDTCKHVLQMD